MLKKTPLGGIPTPFNPDGSPSGEDWQEVRDAETGELLAYGRRIDAHEAEHLAETMQGMPCGGRMGLGSGASRGPRRSPARRPTGAPQSAALLFGGKPMPAGRFHFALPLPKHPHEPDGSGIGGLPGPGSDLDDDPVRRRPACRARESTPGTEGTAAPRQDARTGGQANPQRPFRTQGAQESGDQAQARPQRQALAQPAALRRSLPARSDERAGSREATAGLRVRGRSPSGQEPAPFSTAGAKDGLGVGQEALSEGNGSCGASAGSVRTRRKARKDMAVRQPGLVVAWPIARHRGRLWTTVPNACRGPPPRPCRAR